MYADQVEAESNRSVKERLNVNKSSDFARHRPLSGKRQREDDDKWEHDLFEGSKSRSSNRRVGEIDLRLKLQRKSLGQEAQGANASSSSRGTRDLREKLSGISYTRPIESVSLPLRPKPIPQVSKASIKSVIAEPSVPVTKKLASSISKKKTQQNVESLDNFLRSLDLSKYLITFQAEEVDMTTLVHMSDDDLKALGIPMGPRKKILLALGSKV